MKKIIAFFVCATLLFALSACAASTQTPPKPIGIADIFPLEENIFWDYAGTGNEFVPMQVYVEFVRGNRVQLRMVNAGTTSAVLYELKDGELKKLTQIGEAYVREDLTTQIFENGEILLKEPLVVGTSWKISEGTRSITAIGKRVTTPSGTYNAVEVTTEEATTTTRHYYAKGIGLIKMTVSGEYAITQELLRYAPSVPLNEKILFYYPRMTDTDILIFYQEKTIPLYTNMNMKDVLMTHFQTPIQEGLAPLMSAAAKINILAQDRETGIVHVDFSPELITEMNAGAGLEASILQCIVNSLCKLYNADKVLLTIDDKPYESGHIAYKIGETIPAKYEGTIKLE